jgi:hypothetical protein
MDIPIEKQIFCLQSYPLYLMWRLREISRWKNGWGDGATFGKAWILPKLRDKRSENRFLDSLLLLMWVGLISDLTAYIITPTSINGEAEKVVIQNPDQLEIGYIRNYIENRTSPTVYHLQIRIDKINKCIDQYLIRWWNSEFISPEKVVYPVSMQYDAMLDYLSGYKDAFLDQWHSISASEFDENFDLFLILLFLEQRNMAHIASQSSKNTLTADETYEDEIARSFQIRIVGDIRRLKDAKPLKIYYDVDKSLLWIDGENTSFINQQAKLMEFLFDQIKKRVISFDDILDGWVFDDSVGEKGPTKQYLFTTFNNINRKIEKQFWLQDFFDTTGWVVSFSCKYLIIQEERKEFNTF